MAASKKQLKRAMELLLPLLAAKQEKWRQRTGEYCQIVAPDTIPAGDLDRDQDHERAPKQRPQNTIRRFWREGRRLAGTWAYDKDASSLLAIRSLKTAVRVDIKQHPTRGWSWTVVSEFDDGANIQELKYNKGDLDSKWTSKERDLV